MLAKVSSLGGVAEAVICKILVIITIRRNGKSISITHIKYSLFMIKDITGLPSLLNM
jgi:hypothetical protein